MARKVARRGGLLLKILAQAHLISSTVTPNNRDVPVQESLSQVLACGNNYHGQLGVGDRDDREVPWPLPFGPYTATVAEASETWSVVLTSRGAAYAWGEDTGTLGLVPDDGLPPTHDQAATQTWDVTTPHQIMATDADVATTVATGPTHTLLSTRTGLFAIGNNRRGQLGVGDMSNRRDFTRVPMATAVLSLAVGAHHSVVATVEGTVFVFGSNEYGQLGVDSEEEGVSSKEVYSLPKQVVSLREHFIERVAAGLHHTIALTSSLKVFVWGANDLGQLGLGDKRNRPAPILLEAFEHVQSVACGLSHTALVTSNGSVWTAGNNNAGQLGLGDLQDRTRFSRVEFQHTTTCDTLNPANLSESFVSLVCVGTPDRPVNMSAVSVSAGSFHTLAIAMDGNVWSWGLNSHGQLGIGYRGHGRFSVRVPVPLATVYSANTTSVAAGKEHTVLRTDFQKAKIHEVLPRVGPASLHARTHIWWLGIGFNSLRNHELRCVYEGDAYFETAAEVYSNFRAVCPSPAAAPVLNHSAYALGVLSPVYNISLHSRGVAAPDAKDSQPRPPVSEMTSRTVDARARFTFHLLGECNLPVPSDCASHCSEGRQKCFAGVVSSVPLSGPREGGTDVTVVGYGFYSELASDVRCRFGDHLEGTQLWSRGLILNDTHVTCRSTFAGDALHADAGDWRVQLRVSLNGQDYSTVSSHFFYYRHPRLTHTSLPLNLAASEQWLERPGLPYGGPQTGATEVWVHGRDSFESARLGAAQCSFDGVRVAATFVSRQQIRCISPAMASESPFRSVHVSVIINGVSIPPVDGPYRATFIAYKSPTVTSVVPSAAPTRGSVVIRLQGIHLNVFSWFPRCVFGSMQTAAYVMDASTVVCPTTVVNATTRIEFQYLPNAQDAAFHGYFTPPGNETNANACFPNCTRVASNGGLIASATAPGLQNTTWPQNRTSLMFAFFPHPTVLALSLGGSPMRGGSLLDISGRGFHASLGTTPVVRFHCRADVDHSFTELSRKARLSSVFYGVVDAPVSNPNVVQATIVSGEMLQCITPAVSCKGPFEVSVALNGYDFHSDPPFAGSLPMEFFASPVLERFEPLGGPITGNTSVTIFGSGLLSYAENPQCRFGPGTDEHGNETGADRDLLQTPGRAISDRLFVCPAPSRITRGLVRVSVALNGADFEPVGSIPFTYYRMPIVSSLFPAGGPSVGGTHVAIRGTGFLSFPLGGKLTCRFGQAVVYADNMTTNSRSTCVAPKNLAGTVTVKFSLNGQDYGSKVFFHYYELPTLSSSVPLGGPPIRDVQVSTKVHVYGAGFLRFHGNTLCRFGCALSTAVVYNDQHLICHSPWPGDAYHFFRDDCAAQQKRFQCDSSACTSDGCKPSKTDETLNITCVLDTWLEISLNGVDFTSGSDMNFRYYHQPTFVWFGPTGGPRSGRTLIEITTGSLGGFQRLNDGSLTLDVGGNLLVCENEAGETVLFDDFDALPPELQPNEVQTSSILNFTTTKKDAILQNLEAYVFDRSQWENGEALVSDKLCGGVAQSDITTSVVDTGNEQGFGAKLVNITQETSSLQFTGKTSDVLIGRYALSRSLDLSRGARFELSVRRGGDKWPKPCEAPDPGDDLHLMYRTEAYAGRISVPMWNERSLWSTLETFDPTDPKLATSTFVPFRKRLNASRHILGTRKPTQNMIDCMRHQPCNSSLSRILFLQPNHGSGPYDVWALDNIKIEANGGITSDKRAVCRIPPARAGVVSAGVSLALNGQQFVPVSNGNTAGQGQFIYYEEPVIDMIDPSGGPDGGGTVITMVGSGFQNFADPNRPPKCRFGSQMTSAVVISDTKVKCQGVRDTLYTGFATVAVALNGVDFTEGPVQYIYYFQPSLRALYPTSGPAEGGTDMYVIGEGMIYLTPFPPACKFTSIHSDEESIITPGRYLNDSLLLCKTPNVTRWFEDQEMSVEAVVEVSLNEQQFTRLESLVFTFYTAPQITLAEQGLTGKRLVVNGGDPVTVYGKKLRKEAELKCVHKTRDAVCSETNCTNGVYVSSLYVHSEKMYCAAPSFPAQTPTQQGLGSSASVVQIAVNGHDVSKDEADFRYYTPLDTTQQVKYTGIGAVVLGVLIVVCYLQYKRRKKHKMVKTNEEWKRPDINVADEHRHEVGIRKYGTRKYDWRKTSCDELGELGEGVGLYFRFLKYFGQTFTIMALMAISSMIFNSSGVAYSSKNIQADPILKSTIGNIGSTSDGTGNLIIFAMDYFDLYVTMPKDLVSLISAALDAGIIFVFWLSYLNWLSFQGRVSEVIDKDTLTCSDYTVLVENVPRNATDQQEWLEFFNKQAPIHDHHGKVSSIVIALNNGKLLAMSEQRTALEDSLAILRAQLAKTKYEDWQKKVKTAEKELDKMRSKMGKMRARTDFKAVALFVTFESEATRSEMEDNFHSLIARKGTLFRNRHRLRVRRAPEPDVILWENLQSRGFVAFLRESVVLIVSILILFVSGTLIILVASSKNQLFIEGFPSYCSDAADPNMPGVQESIMWLKYSKGPKVYRAYLKCYCAPCAIGCGDKAGTEPGFCQEWLDNERNLLLLTLASAVAPAAINQVLKNSLKTIVLFEKKHTTNERDSSLAANIFYAQFLNTAAIALIINMDVVYFVSQLEFLGKNGYELLTGEFRDMDSRWYMTVGYGIIPTVFAASISPNVAHFAKWPTVIVQMIVAKTSSLTQRQLNKAYEGLDVELSERYAAMLNSVFVILMYSPGMPIIYCFGVVFFASAYWADKITMLEVYKRPAQMDSTLVRMAASKCKWAVYLHLSFAAWMFGALHGHKIYVPIITELADAGLRSKKPGQDMGAQMFLALIADRLRYLPSFVPFSMLVAMVARDVLNLFLWPAWRFGREWWRRRKRRLERKQWLDQRKMAGYDVSLEEAEEEEDSEEEDGLRSSKRTPYRLPYSEALEYSELKGIESYDVLKNPRYRAAYEDNEYIPADDTEESDLSDGSFGDDIDDLGVEQSASAALVSEAAEAGPGVSGR